MGELRREVRREARREGVRGVGRGVGERRRRDVIDDEGEKGIVFFECGEEREEKTERF